VKLAVKPPWEPHLDFRREGTLVVHLHRRRSGRLPPRPHGASFLDHDGHLTRPSMVERKRQRKGVSLVANCRPPYDLTVDPAMPLGGSPRAAGSAMCFGRERRLCPVGNHKGPLVCRFLDAGNNEALGTLS
jgi:hypothetical protein